MATTIRPITLDEQSRGEIPNSVTYVICSDENRLGFRRIGDSEKEYRMRHQPVPRPQ